MQYGNVVCPKCNGSEFVYWYELDSNAGHDPTSLVIDDTKYQCDECGAYRKYTVKLSCGRKSYSEEIVPVEFWEGDCDLMFVDDEFRDIDPMPLSKINDLNGNHFLFGWFECFIQGGEAPAWMYERDGELTISFKGE